MVRKIAVIMLALAALTLAAVSYQQAEARRLHTEIATVCGQIPTFLAARDYTVKTWPMETASVMADVKIRLGYFGYIVESDKNWCEGAAAYDSPSDIDKTLRWHFGNASEVLRAYQQQAQGSGAPAQPTATATAMPQATPTSIPSVTATAVPATPTATAAAAAPSLTVATPMFAYEPAPAQQVSCPSSGGTIFQDHAVVAWLRWTGSGTVQVAWFRDGQPFGIGGTALPVKSWNLTGPSGCGYVSTGTEEASPLYRSTYWQTGTYRADVIYQGQVIASGTFSYIKTK